jgi:exodeoxyribonuclease III
MKIISCNVNGIRAAYKKGLLDFITKENPDILCFQEIKARKEDFPRSILKLNGYNLFLNSAEKKGYSGVAVFTKEKPISVKKSFSFKRFDKEGRLLELNFPKFNLFNLYLPHGGREKENLGYKMETYQKVFRRIIKLKNKNIILIGDFNIAHAEIDLARPKENKDNIMFTPEEREQIEKLLSLGFVDSFRQFNHKSGNYTWFPYAFRAKERNLGWRIDYAFVSNKFSRKIKKVTIYSKANFSDHCPIGLEL